MTAPNVHLAGRFLSRQPAGRRRSLIALHGVMSVNAFAGAWYALGGAPGVPTEWLHRSPFRDYAIPGTILGSAVAGTQLAAAVALMRGTRGAGAVSLAASGVLLAWIVTQLAMIGYVSPLQPIVLAWALATMMLARRLEA